MRADVADRPQRAALVGFQPPVPVGVEQQPVLEVVTRREADIAEIAGADRLPHVLVQRVEADVVADRSHQRQAPGQVNQSCSFAGGHGQRLLANDMLARGQGQAALLSVQPIG